MPDDDALVEPWIAARLEPPEMAYFRVPFDQRDVAKSAGAQFDRERKLWCLPTRGQPHPPQLAAYAVVPLQVVAEVIAGEVITRRNASALPRSPEASVAQCLLLAPALGLAASAATARPAAGMARRTGNGCTLRATMRSARVRCHAKLTPAAAPHVVFSCEKPPQRALTPCGGAGGPGRADLATSQARRPRMRGRARG